MRNNRSEIWAGNAKNYRFRRLDDVDKVNIVTYFSESKARSSCSSWDSDFVGCSCFKNSGGREGCAVDGDITI